MEMSDNIIFIFEGKKEWEGTNKMLFDAENKELNNFVFASELYKKVKKFIQ
jgi:phospholipid/cholesterol/gamma-HCH transport system ATP-binding protein